MYFRILHDEASGSASFLLADLDAGEAVLVDPRGTDVALLAAMLDEHRLRLRWLLRTHEHDDQLPGEAAALDTLGAPRILCGDLLAVDACPLQPRPALPDALWDSVTREVFTLPNETLLFSAHARQARAVSTVLEQRRWHPWFGGASRDEFLTRVRLLPASMRQTRLRVQPPAARPPSTTELAS